ncbi:MAG: DciA family protein [Patescibacteria group bacterium]
MALTPIGTLVEKAAKRTGVNQQIRTALALERCRHVLDALLDEETRTAVRPASIRYKQLTLACRHSSVAACVGPFEVEILEYVNKGLPYPIVERLRVILETVIPSDSEESR